MWVCAGFFALGYFPTVIAKSPVISMVVAAAAMVPVGSRSSGPVRGAIRGAILGAIAGVGSFGAVTYRAPAGATTQPASATQTAPASSQPASAQTGPCGQAGRMAATAPAQQASTQPAGPRQLTPAQLRRLAFACIGGTVLRCAAVGALFAQLARNRRRFLDRQWDR